MMAEDLQVTGEKSMVMSKGALQKSIKDLYLKDAAKGTRSCEIALIKGEAYYTSLSENDIEAKLERFKQIVVTYCAPNPEPMRWFGKLVRKWYEHLENGKGNTIKHSVMEKLENFECNLEAERIQGRAFTF